MSEDHQQSVPEDEQVINAYEAGKLLGIGHTKLAQLFKEWERTGKQGLPFRHSTLDSRGYLVLRRDVDTLLQQSQGITVEEARTQLAISRKKMKKLIERNILLVRQNPLDHHVRFVDPESLNNLLAERTTHASGNAK